MLSIGWFAGAGCYGANSREDPLDWVYIYVCVFDAPFAWIGMYRQACFEHFNKRKSAIAYVPANRFGALKMIIIIPRVSKNPSLWISDVGWRF